MATNENPSLPPLQVVHFYQCCATFHPDLYLASPLESNETLIPSPLPQNKPLRVTEKTSGWWEHPPARRKVASGHPCLLVEYNEQTGVGTIFLGSSKPQEHSHRFVDIGSHKFSDSSDVFLDTDVSKPFPLRTRLNFTHPLRVRLHYVSGPTLNVLRKSPSTLDNTQSPPTVGVRCYHSESGPPGLTETGKEVFWGLHKKYHSDRRGKPVGTQEDGAGPGCCPGGGTSGFGRGTSGCGATAGGAALGGAGGAQLEGQGPGCATPRFGRKSHNSQPMFIGPYKVGRDIPATFEDPDVDYPDDSEDEPEPEKSAFDELPIEGDMFIWNSASPWIENAPSWIVGDVAEGLPTKTPLFLLIGDVVA